MRVTQLQYKGLNSGLPARSLSLISSTFLTYKHRGKLQATEATDSRMAVWAHLKGINKPSTCVIFNSGFDFSRREGAVIFFFKEEKYIQNNNKNKKPPLSLFVFLLTLAVDPWLPNVYEANKIIWLCFQGLLIFIS